MVYATLTQPLFSGRNSIGSALSRLVHKIMLFDGNGFSPSVAIPLRRFCAPINSFFFASTEITGCCRCWNCYRLVDVLKLHISILMLLTSVVAMRLQTVPNSQ